MDFPWDAVGTILGVLVIILLIVNAPAILGMLLGQIIRFIRNLFGKGDDDI